MWGNIRKKESEESTPTPNPSPHSQRKHAARGGGEHGEPSGEGLMARDPLVDLVFAHMTPRYVATGVDPNDLQRLVQRIERWDDWCRIWSEEGARHEALAIDAAKRGRKVTAAEANLRASIYFHYAKHLFAHDPDQYLAAHQRMLACYQAGTALADPPVERINISFGIRQWLATFGGRGNQRRRRLLSFCLVSMPARRSCTPGPMHSCSAGWRHWRSMGRARERPPSNFRSRPSGAR